MIVRHSRGRVALAAVLAGNGVLVGLLADANPWLSYTLFSLAAGVALLGAWYLWVPMFSLDGDTCRIRRSPGTRKLEVDLSDIAHCSYDAAARRLTFEDGSGETSSVAALLTPAQIVAVGEALRGRAISFSASPEPKG